MDSKFILPFMLRFLPPLIVLGLAFLAASDKKTREHWANLMYQAGSVRPDQRDDPKVQGGVKWPFIVLAFLLLFLPAKIGPLSYYRWVTDKPEPVLNLSQGKGILDLDTPKPEGDPNVVPTPTAPAGVAGIDGSTTVATAPPPPMPGTSGGSTPGSNPLRPSAPASSGSKGGGLGALR